MQFRMALILVLLAMVLGMPPVTPAQQTGASVGAYYDPARGTIVTDQVLFGEMIDGLTPPITGEKGVER